MRLCHCCCCC